MKVLSYGSLNVDRIYNVDHFVSPGETLPCKNLSYCAGGKGLNQAVACARAGADTYMAGCINANDTLLVETLNSCNINTENLVRKADVTSGHAVIQIDSNGQNSILIFRGANSDNDPNQVEKTLSQFSAGDYVLLENEININEEIINLAHSKGLKVCLNPSPMNKSIINLPLEKLTYLILNEIECLQLLQMRNITESNYNIRDCDISVDIAKSLINRLSRLYPSVTIILTLGEKGCLFKSGDECLFQNSYSVKAVDTTAAGDTFTGYFIASKSNGLSNKEALDRASNAASICVTKIGAARSIPTL